MFFISKLIANYVIYVLILVDPIIQPYKNLNEFYGGTHGNERKKIRKRNEQTLQRS